MDEAGVGATPSEYTAVPGGPEVTTATAVLLLIGSLLGDPFSYLSQQLASSSASLLEWHNEDAFHPHRADVRAGGGSEGARRVAHRGVQLGDHRFRREQPAGGRVRADPAENLAPERISILSGDPDSAYVRIDPASMQHGLDDPAAEQALEATIEAFTARMQNVAMTTGEQLIIDNKRAVHGRRPFQARYDGTDRWLRRINVGADLRSSSGRRFGAHGRALV